MVDFGRLPSQGSHCILPNRNPDQRVQCKPVNINHDFGKRGFRDFSYTIYIIYICIYIVFTGHVAFIAEITFNRLVYETFTLVTRRPITIDPSGARPFN